MKTVASADRILAILDLFTEDRLEWTPDQMMAALGYSRPTLYRYLRSLKDTGFLVSLPGAGFTLGPRVVEMDFLMRKSDPLAQAAGPMLRRIAESWPCTALIVRWYGAKLLCIASECSLSDPQSSYPRGRPMPLARGAISRAILAHLPRRQMMQKIGENLTELRFLGLGQTAAEIADALRQQRRQGAVVAYGEVTPGVIGVAAPVFDAGRSPIAALCATLHDSPEIRAKTTQIAADIWTSAQGISDILSDRRSDEDGTQRRTA